MICDENLGGVLRLTLDRMWLLILCLQFRLRKFIKDIDENSPNDLSKMKIFAFKHSNLVVQLRTVPQKIGSWTFTGFIVCEADQFVDLYGSLKVAGILPDQFFKYFSINANAD